jgi:Peptidase M15.
MEVPISPHLTLENLCFSRIAKQLGIDNHPQLQQIGNLCRIANDIYERLYDRFGEQIEITSGYRNDELNSAVGGSKTSAHLDGRALDISIGLPRANRAVLLPVLLVMRDMLDQIIVENGGVWIHIALASRGEVPRRQVLESYKDGGVTKYRDWGVIV